MSLHGWMTLLRYDDGYHNIINIDNSPVVITQMMARNIDRCGCLETAQTWPIPAKMLLIVEAKDDLARDGCARISVHDRAGFSQQP